MRPGWFPNTSFVPLLPASIAAQPRVTCCRQYKPSFWPFRAGAEPSGPERGVETAIRQAPHRRGRVQAGCDVSVAPCAYLVGIRAVCDNVTDSIVTVGAGCRHVSKAASWRDLADQTWRLCSSRRSSADVGGAPAFLQQEPFQPMLPQLVGVAAGSGPFRITMLVIHRFLDGPGTEPVQVLEVISSALLCS